MSDDLIKRSDAIAEIYKVRTPDVASHHYAELFINAVCRSPSADRPEGEWIEGKYDLMCSNCENTQEYEKFPYCPYCGAKMADRKTENCSEKPNNCEDLQDWKDRMWAEAIVTEPQTESEGE